MKLVKCMFPFDTVIHDVYDPAHTTRGLYTYLEFLRELVFCLELFAEEDEIPRGVVHGDVRQVEAPLAQVLQITHTRRAQEHDDVRIFGTDHLTLEAHARMVHGVFRVRNSGHTQLYVLENSDAGIPSLALWADLNLIAQANHEDTVDMSQDVVKGKVELRTHKVKDVIEGVAGIVELFDDPRYGVTSLQDVHVPVEDEMEREGSAESRRADQTLIAKKSTIVLKVCRERRAPEYRGDVERHDVFRLFFLDGEKSTGLNKLWSCTFKVRKGSPGKK